MSGTRLGTPWLVEITSVIIVAAAFPKVIGSLCVITATTVFAAAARSPPHLQSIPNSLRAKLEKS